MVPNKYLPSQLGEIPNDWDRVALSDVMSVRQGLQIAISKRLKVPTNTSKEYITIQSIKKTGQLREYVEAPTKRVTCNREDVLMTRTGNTGIVVTDVEGVFHNNFFLMDFDRQRIDKIFLVNYLRSPRVQHLILTKAGASTIPDLNHRDFYSIEFPLAPLPQQHKIANILSTWDKAISATDRLIDNSKQQKKALMQQLLTGKKRLLDNSGKPFEGEWEEVLLGQVASLTAGGTPSTKHPEYWGGEILWMNSGEVNLKQVYTVEGRITEQGLKKSSTKEIPENSILIALAGQGKTRGTVAISRIKLCTNQSIAAIMPNEHKLNFDFLYFNLDGRYQELRSMSTGDGGRGGLNLNILKSIKLTLPSIIEQKKIASVLTNADKEVELLEKQLDDLKQEKKALMQQLLTGKRRVKINDTEAA